MSQPEIKFSPLSGTPCRAKDIVRAPELWRKGGGWAFNPWTGRARAKADIESDPMGLLIWDDAWGPMKAAARVPNAEPCTYIGGGGLIKLEVHPGARFEQLKLARRFLDLLIDLEAKP